MIKRSLIVAIAALVVCMGILLLQQVRSSPESVRAEPRGHVGGQAASTATSPRERGAEGALTKPAPGVRPGGASALREGQPTATGQGQVGSEEMREAPPEPPAPENTRQDDYIPPRAIEAQIMEVQDKVYGDDGDRPKPTREQAREALDIVEDILKDYPKYEAALAMGIVSSCALGDVASARRYMARMTKTVEPGRVRCKELGVEL
jgi:hypothetical protein